MASTAALDSVQLEVDFIRAIDINVDDRVLVNVTQRKTIADDELFGLERRRNKLSLAIDMLALLEDTLNDERHSAPAAYSDNRVFWFDVVVYSCDVE